MSDQEFLLYPLDTGEDPVCLGCGSQMAVAGHEVREIKPDFISFRCPNCGRSEKFLVEECRAGGSTRVIESFMISHRAP